MRLTVEAEGAPAQRFVPPGNGAALAAFCSFAAMRGFGAVHPLIALAERLQESGVRMGPLTMFYDEAAEDAEDLEKLELAWQDRAALAEALAGLAAALEADPEAAALARRGGAEGLAGQARAAAEFLAGAAGARARMVYRL